MYWSSLAKQLRFMLAAFAVCSLLFTSAAHAALSITNGDMETNAPAANVADVDSWYDANGAGSQTDGAWWTSTWYGPTVSPNGTSVMGLSAEPSTGNTHWAYQNIGTNDSGLTNLAIGFDLGSFTDSFEIRDIGVTVGVYQSDGSLVPADGVDIDGAAGVTLIGTASTSSVFPVGGGITGVGVNIDISSANATDDLFLRFINFDNGDGLPWAVIDNVAIVPEPNTLGLMVFGGLLALHQRRQRR